MKRAESWFGMGFIETLDLNTVPRGRRGRGRGQGRSRGSRKGGRAREISCSAMQNYVLGNKQNKNCTIFIQNTWEKSSFCKTEYLHQHDQRILSLQEKGKQTNTQMCDGHQRRQTQMSFIIQILNGRQLKIQCIRYVKVALTIVSIW